MTYPDFLLALCLWREARSVGPEEWLGVYWVIKNRVGKIGFKPSLVRVILQPLQFSSFNRGDPNSAKFPNESVARDWAAWNDILDFLADPGPDPTSGALYYESFAVDKLPEVRQHQPWFSAAKQTAQIGPFRFYRG